MLRSENNIKKKKHKQTWIVEIILTFSFKNLIEMRMKFAFQNANKPDESLTLIRKEQNEI